MAPDPDQPVRPAHPPFRLLSGLGRKAAELVTVFIGVYAAFLLNNYQLHRGERQRREQILDWLDKDYSEQSTQLSRRPS